MAPEQAAGDPDVDHRADLYAWGVVAYELLAGRHPFAGKRSPQAYITAQLTETPESLAAVTIGVPPTVCDIVRRCLAKEPADRPGSAVDLVEALDLSPSLESRIAASTSFSPTVAVLPFTNLSSDPENEYLSDGITDEIIGTLGRLRRVRVAGRASSFALKGQQLEPRAIGARLNVTFVVVGSVRRMGNRLRVAVELVDAADGFQRWSERYDRDMTDIFAVQDDIAQAIASALTERLLTPAGGDARHLTAAPALRPNDPEAYRLYLLARHTLRSQLSSASYDRVLSLLDQALARDPRLARAHALKAIAYHNLAIFSLRAPREVFPLAREAAQRAVALDPGLGEAYTMLAQVAYGFDWNWDGVEKAYARAAAADPSDTGTLVRAALFHAASRRAGIRHEEEALRLVQLATALDPLSPWVRFVGGTALWLLGRMDEAATLLREAVELDPHHGLWAMTFGGVLRDRGELEEALDLMERALRLTGRNPLVLVNAAVTRIRMGDRAGAEADIDELLRRAPTERVAPVYVAEALAWLGRHDEAFAWLDRALEDRDFWLAMLGVDPLADPLRGDPRFDAVMRRVGIPGI